MSESQSSSEVKTLAGVAADVDTNTEAEGEFFDKIGKMAKKAMSNPMVKNMMGAALGGAGMGGMAGKMGAGMQPPQ